MKSTGDIVLRHGVTQFVPGEEISGEAVWMSEGEIELRLFWMTEGRGTPDMEIVDHANFPGSAMKGAFSFVLPTMPYSFTGSLVSVRWMLELVDEDEEVLASESITVSPIAEEIVLPVVNTRESLRNKRKEELLKRGER